MRAPTWAIQIVSISVFYLSSIGLKCKYICVYAYVYIQIYKYTCINRGVYIHMCMQNTYMHMNIRMQNAYKHTWTHQGHNYWSPRCLCRERLRGEARLQQETSFRKPHITQRTLERFFRMLSNNFIRFCSTFRGYSRLHFNFVLSAHAASSGEDTKWWER